MSKPCETVNRLWWLWLLGAMAIYGVLAWMVPMEYDSLRFDAIYRRYNGGSEGFSWAAWYHYARELAEIDNARLSNIVAPVMSLVVPRWLWGLLTGLAIAVMLGFATLLTGARRRLPVLAIIWVLCILLLPWSNYMWVGDYALNYIYAGALTMLLAWLVLNDVVETRRTVALRLTIAYILAAIVGWWHEQFALALACGFLAWVAVGRPFGEGRPTPARPGSAYILVIALVMIAVAVVALSCPGMVVRFYHSGVEIRTSSLAQVLMRNAATLLLWAILLVGLIFGGRSWWRYCCSRPIVVVMSAGALASLAIHMAMGAASRSGFAGTLMAIVALVTLSVSLKGRGELHPRLVASLSVVAILLCYAQGVLACVVQYPYYKQYQEIMADIKAHPGQTIYRDLLPVYQVKKWQRGMSSRATWIDPFTYVCLWEEESLDGSVVVPTCLDRDLDAFPAPGMVSDTVPAPDSPTPYYYHDDRGRSMHYLPFRDRKGRLRYYYFCPDEY